MKQKSRTAVSPKLVFREAGMQVSPVTMSGLSQKPLLCPVYKRIKGQLKKGLGLFAFCLCFLV
jgi:hypothetical protein